MRGDLTVTPPVHYRRLIGSMMRRRISIPTPFKIAYYRAATFSVNCSRMYWGISSDTWSWTLLVTATDRAE